MATCRCCRTPNRAGRKHCVVCGEAFNSPNWPPEETVSSPEEPAKSSSRLPNSRPDPQKTRLGLGPAPSEVPQAAVPDALESPSSPAPELAPTAAWPAFTPKAAFSKPSPPEKTAAFPAPPVAAADKTVPLQALRPVAPEASFPSSGTGPEKTVPLPATPGIGSAEAPPEKVPSTPSTRPLAQPEQPSGDRPWISRLVLLVALAIILGSVGWALLRAPSRVVTHSVDVRIGLDGVDREVPEATLVVIAPPDVKLTVDGENLKEGQSTHRLGLRNEALGESSTVDAMQRVVQIESTWPDGTVRLQTVSIEAPITPLTLAGPGPRWVRSPGTLVASGTSAPNALIRAGKARVRADERGAFLLPLGSPPPGEVPLTATSPGHVTRTVVVHVFSQASLPPPTPFDALESRLGGRIRVDGKVIEARQLPEGTSFLLQVDHGCSGQNCRISALLPARLAADEFSPFRPGRELSLVGEMAHARTSPQVRVEALIPR